MRIRIDLAEPMTKRRATGAVAALFGLAAFIAKPVASADPVPTLGVDHPFQWAEGFGTVQPQAFSIASTGSSTVTHVTWDSWGGPQAVGHGLDADGAYNPPLHMKVVADDLGTCRGQLVYRPPHPLNARVDPT
jgi:hypothetical protein